MILSLNNHLYQKSQSPSLNPTKFLSPALALMIVIAMEVVTVKMGMLKEIGKSFKNLGKETSGFIIRPIRQEQKFFNEARLRLTKEREKEIHKRNLEILRKRRPYDPSRIF